MMMTKKMAFLMAVRIFSNLMVKVRLKAFRMVERLLAFLKMAARLIMAFLLVEMIMIRMMLALLMALLCMALQRMLMMTIKMAFRMAERSLAYLKMEMKLMVFPMKGIGKMNEQSDTL